MEQFILDVLGPYATAWLLVPLVIVVVLRNVLRKRHILFLLATCVLSFIAAVGYAFILKSLGLASLAGAGSAAPPRRRANAEGAPTPHALRYDRA